MPECVLKVKETCQSNGVGKTFAVLFSYSLVYLFFVEYFIKYKDIAFLLKAK